MKITPPTNYYDDYVQFPILVIFTGVVFGSMSFLIGKIVYDSCF